MDTRHPDEGTIHAYAERQLSPAEQARAEEHIANCAECAASVAEARGLIAAATRIVGALDNVPDRVIPARPARRFPPWLAAAAVMVLAVGVSSVAVRSGLESRRSVPAVAADAAGGLSQQVVSESQASAAVEPTIVKRDAVTARATGATGSAPATRRETGAPRPAPATATPDQARNRSVREEAVVLSAPVISALPAAPQAPPKAGADFSAADAEPAAGVRAMGAAAPTGRVAARAPATAPSETAALSLRQSKTTITGRVMTENGQPLAGANVHINELNISVDTDAAGRYSLTIPSDRLDDRAAIVRAAAIGYAPQEQELKVAAGSQTADFELRQQRMQLSEVVVTGGTTVRAEEPMRTIRYEAASGVTLELREYHAAAPVPPARQGVNEYRWSDATGARRYVLSGPLPVAELRQLAGRLGELRVVR